MLWNKVRYISLYCLNSVLKGIILLENLSEYRIVNKLGISNAGGSIGPEDGKTVCSKGEVFDEILPLEELASVSVGGVEFPIPAE